MPTPDQPACSQFAHRIVHLSRMRVRPTELDMDVLESAHGPHPQLPVAAGVAAEQYVLLFFIVLLDHRNEMKEAAN